MTLLMMLTMSLTASATTFITDVMVIGNNNETAFYNLQSSYEAQGWIAINKDLNAGCGSGSDYIHLLYKTSLCTGSSSTSITDFYIKTGSNAPATLTHQGRTYYLVPFDGSTNFINSKGDLNRGAGGDYIHLYYTKEALSNPIAVTAINFNATQSGAVGSNGGSTGYDLNEGCGSGTNYIYMHVTTASTAGSYTPQSHLDACTGGTANIYLSGWTFDRDASSESLVVHVYIYTDSGYSNLYMPVQVVHANVPRPDVNSAYSSYNITGDHGFKTNILIADAGNYWIRMYAIDYNGGTNALIGSRSVTVTAGNIVTLTSESGNVQLHQGDVLTGTGGPNTHVTIDDGATVTLVGVNITDIANNSSHCWSGLTCLGDAVIVLEVGSTNDVKGGYVSSGIRVPVGKTLTIQGNGTLNATGVGGGAGIGSALDTSTSCGNITISGGTINATGGNGGAGIGSGLTTSCGNITINGGTVNATGGEDAAGIGSGYYYSSCGNITITNGVTRVTATKGSGANNAIGAGTNSSCGTVTIGSVVTGFITQSPFITYPYTVSFNANGGTGTMSNMNFMYNVAQQLSANGFTFTDHNFIGWATSANGPKVYDDEQSVSNLTSTAGATVTLFAKWRLICYQPTALAAEVDAHSAILSWEGTSGSYIVRHREPEYSENDFFEAFNTNTLPTGWKKYTGLVDSVVDGNATLVETVSNSWRTNTYALGTYNMGLNIYGSNVNHWLVTPNIENLNGNMTFDLALTAWNSANAASGTCVDDRFVVLVYANNAWSKLCEWNNRNSNYVFNEIATEGEHVSIDLSAYTGQTVKIAFYGESTVNSNGDNDVHIDNIAIGHRIITPATEWETVTVNETTVTLTELNAGTTYEVMVQGFCGTDNYSEWSDMLTLTTDATCFVPTNLTCIGMTATTATLTWESEASAWQIILNNDASNLIDVDENPFTLTGLTTETIYTAKVKALCGSEGESGWSDAVNFEPTDKLIIGSGDGNFNYLPFNNYYKYSLSQQIYTIAELGEAGIIDCIDFFKISSVECNRNLDIYMVHTDKDEFENTSDWIPVTAEDRVFRGIVSFSDNAWTAIPLSKSFHYDGLHNVAIVVDDNTGSYKSNTYFNSFVTEQNQSIYYQSDSNNYDPTATPGQSADIINKKNQIRLLKSEPDPCIKPTNLAFTEIANHSTTLSWIENGEATTWQIMLNDDEQNLINTNENPFTLTNLTPETTYNVKVRAYCNDAEQSQWSNTVNFTDTGNNILTVYDGMTINQYIPAYVYFFDDYTRSQFVIPANDLSDMNGGTISGMKFYATSSNIPYTTESTVDVYLMEVDYTTISAFEPKENGTIVYQGTLEFVSSNDGGELSIHFSPEYTYSGGNLLIGIENTINAEYQDIRFYGQTVQGASGAASNSSSLGEVQFTQRNFIPKTTFTYTPGEPPTNISLTKEIIGYGTGSGNWYLIASPIAEAVTPSAETGFLSNAYDLYRFDLSNENDEWENYKVDSFNLVNGQGYLYANSENVTLVFTGSPVEVDPYEVTLVYDSIDIQKCWNLVGNPFDCNATLDRVYYVLNEDRTGINPEPIPATTPIPPCTAVFVKAVSVGDTAVFTKVTQ